MLQIRELYYEIGDRRLLNDVSLTVHPGQRIGLVGPNGAGKTTLLRILSGELRPQKGTIIKPKNYVIGYLPQETIVFDQGTLLSAVLESRADVQRLEVEIHDIQQQLSVNPENQERLLQRLGQLQDRFALLGGYEMEAKAKKILSGLGFTEKDFFRPLKDFSGGWRMRAYLAKLLLIKPDLLLLDEPTNHLDLPSLEWIENFLKAFTGSMIIVSHDRFFLDRLAQNIAELNRGQLKLYAGNYRFYEQAREREEELLLKKWEEQQAEIERIQKFINRFRAKATKAAQVQSRIKRLEKLQRIEPPQETKYLRFTIKASVPSFKDVLRVRELYFRYDSTGDWLLKDLNFNLYRGQRVALVGPNGAGKTTLTRLIHQELKPLRGEVQIGERVHLSYYAQHQVDALNLKNTILQEVQNGAAAEFRGRVRDILGVFGFTGDDVEKPIGVLSGGEKARVSLAKMLLSPANFIIMDEPTNHLDLHSKEALEFALREFDGTLLIISHDRYFLDKLVSRVLELKDGVLKEYEGNYSDYLRLKELQKEKEQPSVEVETKNTRKKSKEQKRQEALARQAISKQRNLLQKEIADLESKIEEAEQRKVQLETLLADPKTYQNSEEAVRLQKEYDALQKNLSSWEDRWEEANMELEALLEKVKS